MATSRDDFVIAIRSAFLKKGNKQRFSLVALIIFSVVLIVLSRINFPAINYLKIGLNEIVYRVSFIVSLPEQQLNRSLIAINNLLNLYNDHDQLKEKFKIYIKRLLKLMSCQIIYYKINSYLKNIQIKN